ncbi:MAG: hypothetical protein AB7F79_04265 [Steroidobacteraceae bacterium]
MALFSGNPLNVLKPETELDLIFLSPSGRLAPRKRTGQFRLGKDHLLVDNNGKISNLSLEDIAVAMLDEVEKPQHSRQTIHHRLLARLMK